MIYSVSQALRTIGCNSKIYFVFQQKGVDICVPKVYNEGMNKGKENPKTRRSNKMNEMEKKQKIVDYINSMNDEEIIELHNLYCEAAECEDDRIYSMYELDELLEGRTPTDILSMGFYGDFRPQHDFFWFNGYGNLESADYITNMPIYAIDIANYILSNEDSLGNDEIQEILDEED